MTTSPSLNAKAMHFWIMKIFLINSAIPFKLGQSRRTIWVESTNPTKMFMKLSADSEIIITYNFKCSRKVAYLERMWQLQNLTAAVLQ
jgi:hypothetical protein